MSGSKSAHQQRVEAFMVGARQFPGGGEAPAAPPN